MRKGFMRYDKGFRTPATTDDESCVSTDFDLLKTRAAKTNSRLYQQPPVKCTGSNLTTLLETSKRVFNRRRSFASYDHVETKLPSQGAGKEPEKRRPLSLQHFPRCDSRKNYEPQVTFAAQNSSSGDGNPGSKAIPKLCADRKSTPRIVRAIHRNSKKQIGPEDRSQSLQRPRPGNSKSSVVVLYHGKPASPEPALRDCQSERSLSHGACQSLTDNAQAKHPDRTSPARQGPIYPIDQGPVYPIDRGQATLRRRRRRRLSRRRGPLAHIYLEKTKEVASLSKDRRVAKKEAHPAGQRSDPARYLAKSAKNLIRSSEGSTSCQEDDSDDPDQAGRSDKHRLIDKTCRERCRPSNNTASKLMARFSLGRGDDKPRRNDTVCPNLAYLMHQMHACPCERGDDRAYISVNDGDDDSKRVFPFQATPSGNLKIVPNQVVFESKKVSVLVADPQHTKVNVKAELNRTGNEAVGRVSESSTRHRLVDLPTGVPSSMINQSQGQKNPTGNEETQRMHQFKVKLAQMEGEQKQQTAPSTSYEEPLLQEVPLSALGFTGEQPIDWDNIILPEKTDLYQELARRITNYKNADCIVRIDQDEFHCHLLVLQSYSAFFDEKNCKEIDLTGSGVSSNAFSIIYDWMISPQNESCRLLQRDNILDIFTAAQYLDIKELEEQCWAFIDNDELFTEDTAFLLYLEARKSKNIAVMELMVPRIMKFFLMLVSTKDFLELRAEELCLLLRSNYISVNSEMEVLMSAVRWLMHDWANRKKHMLEVMRCVRFGLIAPWQLVDVKRNPENPEFMELMSYPEVQKMVDDGLAFVIIKYWYGSQTEDYYHWIDLLGLAEPTNRNWAGEDKNYVTYREFLLYLEEYQRTKVSELKGRKASAKPTPPSSPPNDYPFLPPRGANNFPQSSGDNGAIQNDPTLHSKNAPLNHPPMEMSGIPMPPKFMNDYLSHLQRSRGNKERASNMVAFDARFSGGGESAKAVHKSSAIEKQRQEQARRSENLPNAGKLDYETRQEQNTSDVCRCQQHDSNLIFSARMQQTRCKMPRDREQRTDSGKSEEEAATTIQAVYRGYKARRRFHEIKTSTSEVKRNIKKVAELLAIPMGEASRKSLVESVGISNSSANQIRSGKEEAAWPPKAKKGEQPWWTQIQRPVENKLDQVKNYDERVASYVSGEQRPQPTPRSMSRNAANTIRTIKSPRFFTNQSEIISSPSDNTDSEEPQSPQTDGKSTGTDVDNNARNNTKSEEQRVVNYQGSDNVQQPTTVQIRTSNCPRPPPQRISNSMLGSAVDSYFFVESLYFPDRESVLVFGGVDPHEEYGRGGNTGKAIYRFEPDENIWEFVGEIPQPRHHHSVAYLRGRIYVVGGADPLEDKVHRKSTAVGSVWSYDPTTRTWFNEPGMLTARKDFGLVVSHGKMYAMGGQGRNGITLRTMEAFDPTDSTWREMQPMQTARVGPASVKYRDLIWVAGGMTKSKKEMFSKDVECYDPIKNLWLKAVPLRSPRCFASFYVMSDCLYAIGGASTSEITTQSIDDIDVWDGNECVWKERAKMSIARHGHSIGSIGEQLLIIGGVTTVFLKTLNNVECYCCDIEKWMKGVSALPQPVSGHGTVSLPPANLLIDH
ncbi:uncharacterized protein LOC143208067 isoform X2 [Lasioglossum baleicum]|uniref:uncharacterized protein LOC143208067 isoform X2 n=1 Tax=Lasioglossum baleicum TaxID=434251 RepID=UPI003FCCA22D